MNNNKLTGLINLESIKFIFSIFDNHKSEIKRIMSSISSVHYGVKLGVGILRDA